MKKLLTKLEKRDIIDKHSNERAQKQRVLEKAWNRLNSEKEGSRGYEEELKKFQPSLEVEDIEDAVYQEDLTDMTDILREMIEQTK